MAPLAFAMLLFCEWEWHIQDSQPRPAIGLKIRYVEDTGGGSYKDTLLNMTARTVQREQVAT